MGVKLSPQAQQRLQADLHKHVIARQATETPKQLDDHHRQAEKRDCFHGIEHRGFDFATEN